MQFLYFNGFFAAEKSDYTAGLAPSIEGESSRPSEQSMFDETGKPMGGFVKACEAIHPLVFSFTTNLCLLFETIFFVVKKMEFKFKMCFLFENVLFDKEESAFVLKSLEFRVIYWGTAFAFVSGL